LFPLISDSFAIVMMMYLAIIGCLLVQSITCQMGFGGSAKKAAAGVVRKEELESIGCDVCHKAIEEIVYMVEIERGLLLKNKKLEEIKVLDIIENICKPKHENGTWIKRNDIKQAATASGKYLELVEPGGIGKCKDECETIAKSCENLFKDEIDSDDLSALLYKKQQASADVLKDLVCKGWTSRCKPRRKFLSKSYVRLDEPFEEVSEKDLQMETLMAQMEAQGMSGNMMGKDDMEGMMDGYGDDGYEDGMGGMGGMDAYGEDDGEF
jgi:hypothetical protein